MKKKKLWIVICMLFITMLFVGCGKSDDIVIKTSLGKLHYPKKWEKSVKFKVDDKEENSTVTFRGRVDENYYDLFSAVIEESEGENPVGQLTGPDKTKRNVYIILNDLEKEVGLDEDSLYQLYEMQEDINYLIEHLE